MPQTIEIKPEEISDENKEIISKIELLKLQGIPENAILQILKEEKIIPQDFAMPSQLKSVEEVEAEKPVRVKVEQKSGLPKTAASMLAGLLGGVAGARFGGPQGAALGSSMASGISDALVDKFMGAPPSKPISDLFIGKTQLTPDNPVYIPPGSFLDVGTSAIENTIMNEATGRPLGFLLGKGGNIIKNVASEIKSPGNVVGSMAKYDPTFTQYLDKRRPLLEMVENLFARKSKERALERSGKKAVTELEKEISSLAGKPIKLSDADILAQQMQAKTQQNYKDLLFEIDETDKILKGLNPKDKDFQFFKDKAYSLAAARSSLFYPRGERGLSSKDLINEIQTHEGIQNLNYPNPIINSIVDDAEKMNRFITQGEIKVPGFSGRLEKITTASPEKDLQGYQLQRLINDSYDTANKTLDVDNLINMWNKYKVSTMGKRLYNQQARADIDQLFKEIGKVSTKIEGTGPSRYLTLKLGTGALALGSGILSGLVTGTTGGIATGATIVGGAVGLNILGRAMTNKDTARLTIAAIRGGPLGVSPAVAGRLIGRALRNQPITIYIQDSSGQETPIEGKIDSNGNFKSNLVLEGLTK